MPADIDIIVRSPDSTEVKLVVEVKLAVKDLAAVEEQLKNAMLHVSSPVGLIITPQTIWVYADLYVSSNTASIQMVGEFPITNLLRYEPTRGEHNPREARRFESVVQQWLETLPRTAHREQVGDAAFWGVLSKYVLPALETGDVRAAAPRI